MIDSIIDDIHRVRVQIWERCGCDWDKLAEYLQARSARHPERMVSRSDLTKNHDSAITVEDKP